MRIGRFFLILLAGISCLGQGLSAEAPRENTQEIEGVEQFSEPVQVTLVAEEKAIQSERPFWVAIRFNSENGWHLYWKNPGDAGAAPTIDWNLPEGFSTGQLLWPIPTHFKVSGLSGLGYEEGFTLLTQIFPPKHLASGSDVTLEADVQWVACREQCIPGMPTISLTLPVSSSPPPKNQDAQRLFLEAREKLPMSGMAVMTELKDNQLVLHFSLPEGVSTIQDVEFFPEQHGLADLGRDQILKEQNGIYHLQVPLHQPLETEDFSGIIVFSSADGKKSALEVKDSAKTPHINDHSQLASKISAKAFSDAGKKITNVSTDSAEGFELLSGMGIGLAILAAFGGGVLLNLMPCVLPVLSLKVLSVVKAAGESKLERYKQGFAYVLGVLISFWALAGLLLILRASGEEIGWGFQLQEPIFVGILACLLFVMALNLFGVFELGTSLAAVGGGKQKKSAVLEALWSGVLATIVATPCTGPFLGASLGFAMALPPLGSFAIFTVMGLGMSIPFLLLTICPPLLRLMPKPGQWMVTLKQGMGFLLMASVLWLIWVWEAQTDFIGVMILLGALFLLSFASWYYGNWGQLTNTLKSRIAAVCVAACMIIASSFLIVSASDQEGSHPQGADHAQMISATARSSVDLGWETFSTQRLQELRSQGVPVFIDFTAKWCLLCQANKVIMNSSSVVEAFSKAGVVRMRADWTKKDNEITRMLKQYQRSGVPLYVLYSPGSAQPKFFPETLTADMLIDAAEEIKK